MKRDPDHPDLLQRNFRYRHCVAEMNGTLFESLAYVTQIQMYCKEFLLPSKPPRKTQNVAFFTLDL